MRVSAGEEPSVNSEQALAARNGVTHDGGIGVAQVWARVYVVNRRRDVELAGVGCVCHRFVSFQNAKAACVHSPAESMMLTKHTAAVSKPLMIGSRAAYSQTAA